MAGTESLTDSGHRRVPDHGVGERLVWLAAVPAAALTVGLIVVLGAPLGRVLLPVRTFDFWRGALRFVRPEPTEQARYLISLLGAILVPFCLLVAVRRRGSLASSATTRPTAAVRLVVIAVQLLFVTTLVLGVLCRRDLVAFGISYFSVPTLIVAGVIGFGITFALRTPSLWRRVAAAETWHRPAVGRLAFLLAILVVVIWLLPAVELDSTVARANTGTVFDLIFTYDEGMSVVNGHTPLVNFVAQYGSLWPFLAAIPMHFFNASLGSFTIFMTTITGLCMLAVHGVIRRVARSPVGTLLLFVPFVATSAFIAQGTPVVRYSFVDYFGAFPLRYAGPYFTAYLLARHLAGERPRHLAWIFLAAGLTLLNNGDFGVPSLGAVIIALLVTAHRPVTRRAGLQAAAEGVGGLIAAYALVAVVALARTGQLPDIGAVFQYARVFVLAGYQMVPMPWFGFWVVIYVTFCACLVTAATLLIRFPQERTAAGRLAWCGIFGMGAGAYYAGRSASEVLIALFSIWSLALALLLAVVVRLVVQRGASAGLPQLALCIGFGLCACSVAQFPAPWQSVSRLTTRADTELFEPTTAVRFIKTHVPRGAAVALLTDEGQRMSREADVDDVTPFTGFPSMPTRQQLVRTLTALRQANGADVIVHENGETWPQVMPALRRWGFAEVVASGPRSSPDRYVLFRRRGR